MTYGIVYATNALDDVDDLGPPADIVDCIDRSMAILAINPVQQSYHDVTIFPWGQIFDFTCHGIDALYQFRAIFHYLENEADIRIVDLQIDRWPMR